MTHRRTVIVLTILAVLAALALTRAWWLPPVLAALGDNAVLITSIVAILGLLVAAVAALAQWLGVLRPAAPAADPVALVQPVALETLQATFRDVKGQAFQYINRGATHPTALLGAPRLVIVGPQKVGKSREAVELIGHALEYCHVPQGRIFVPTANFRNIEAAAVAGQIRRDVSTDETLLLFIDDLPAAFRGDELDRLAAALATLARCKALYVVATARDDQLDDHCRTWLVRQRFEPIRLGAWTPPQIAGLVDDGIYLIETKVEDDARAELVEGNAGTPEQTRQTLLQVQEEGRGDRASVAEFQKITLTATWKARRDRLIHEQPATEHLLRAAAAFHVARVTPYTGLVLAQAARGVRGRGRKGRLQAALDRLAAGEVTRVADDQLMLRDYVVEGEGVEGRAAWQGVGEFLLNYRRWLRYPGLRRLHRNRLKHADALFDRALATDEKSEPKAVAGYYTAAIGWRPFFGYYNNRGLLHADQGRPAEALADYDAAIRLNPDYATAYNNRGNLHADQGRPAEARADYDAAIRLNPDYATAYNNRGNLHRNQGRPAEARADYDAAIRLNPDDATAYYNRGLLHADQGRPAEALADYDAAIRLNPDDATAYYNRGMLFRELDRVEEALRDFEERLRLGQNTAGIHLNLAGVYRDLGRADDAARHLALARERLTDDDLYNRACLEAITGNDDLALDLLAQALAEGKADPAWVRRDPDWRTLRDDPRFRRLLGNEV